MTVLGERTNQSCLRQPADLSLDATLAALKEHVELSLRQLLPARESAPKDLHGAMHHTLLAPGKRLRPLLTLLAAGVDKATLPESLQLACVSEIVHAASLILDDLPCMDDAQLRRNQPCTHLLYSESTAILSAMNMLNLSYGLIAGCPAVNNEFKAATAAHLCEVVGSWGLIGGQMADLQDDHATSQPAELEQLYWQKTGGLFEFSVVTGGRLRGLNDEALDALKRFAREFGLAFQIYDDLLDLDGTEEETGKNVGQDQGKPTLVSVQSAANINALLAAARDTALQQLRTAQMESTALWDLAERQFNTAAARARAVGVRSIAS